MHEMKEQSSANELKVAGFVHTAGNSYTKLILCTQGGTRYLSIWEGGPCQQFISEP